MRQLLGDPGTKFFPDMAALAVFLIAVLGGGAKPVAPLKFEAELQLKGTINNPQATA